ncbi:integrating conjugative element protein [Rouxiella silvae]|uniref:Integrating conjugative element protein n=2 Tax=Rouxiella silvae TaxID=1646373 RepID=A0ABX3TTR8_9GAMM|nr:integrating conjugative element protein [Rouxiella silvae]
MKYCIRGLLAMAFISTNSRAELSLPQINDSAMGYGKDVTGAVSDKLYYTLGGGSVISQPGTRSNMRTIGVDLGWNSDMMCGNFDLKTTVGNQLNGITDGFKDLMGEVIQGATGAVASLPAMLIQRANPGLYDALTNGLLQANVGFDKAQLSCQNMAKKLANFTDSSSWSQSAAIEEYKQLVNSGDADAIRIDNAGQKVSGKSGNNWVGGQQRGGKGQAAIRPTHDMAAAGYNMMNGLPVLSSSPVPASSCDGSACNKFSSSLDAGRTIVQVLGDRSMRTCTNSSECTSGGDDQQPGTTVAGTGFVPMFEKAVKTNIEELVKLVNGTVKPNAENLGKLKTGSLTVTAGVIKSLQRDPDNAALTARLASELALAETVEIALLMRQLLITGMSEPNVAAQPMALDEGDRRISALDREINAIRTGMKLKRELSRNSILTIIERENGRVNANPQTQSEDSTDLHFNQLGLPSSENGKDNH